MTSLTVIDGVKDQIIDGQSRRRRKGGRGPRSTLVGGDYRDSFLKSGRRVPGSKGSVRKKKGPTDAVSDSDSVGISPYYCTFRRHHRYQRIRETFGGPVSLVQWTEIRVETYD